MTALLSVFVLAGTFFTAPSSLSAPALCPSAPAVARAQFDGGVIVPTVYCSVDCGLLNPDVSCSGAVCSAVQRSCHGERGRVTCDGNTYYCAPCCTDGTWKAVIVGPTCSCAGGISTPGERYKCINGEWVYQYSFCGKPFCPEP